jgi:hypothetical protein
MIELNLGECRIELNLGECMIELNLGECMIDTGYKKQKQLNGQECLDLNSFLMKYLY